MQPLSAQISLHILYKADHTLPCPSLNFSWIQGLIIYQLWKLTPALTICMWGNCSCCFVDCWSFRNQLLEKMGPIPWVDWGQISTFSEYCRVAYQNKGNGACSNMVANILPADTLDPGGLYQNCLTFWWYSGKKFSKKFKKRLKKSRENLPACKKSDKVDENYERLKKLSQKYVPNDLPE